MASTGTYGIAFQIPGNHPAALVIRNKSTIDINGAFSALSKQNRVPAWRPLLIDKAVKSIICHHSGLSSRSWKRAIHARPDLSLRAGCTPYFNFVDITNEIFIVCMAAVVSDCRSSRILN
jgi:hypothetical protein